MTDSPDEWREILRGWEYPEDAPTESRRERRRAKKAHYRGASRRTAQWVREERRRDPITPTAALVIVLLVLVIGAGARLLWPAGDPASKVATSTASADDKPAGTPSPAPAPEPSQDPAAVDMSDPAAVAEAAVRHYLTRNPPEDGDHTAAVRRAAPYMTRSLAMNLSESADPAYGRLVSRGGISTVTTVDVRPAGAALPVDTPCGYGAPPRPTSPSRDTPTTPNTPRCKSS